MKYKFNHCSDEYLDRNCIITMRREIFDRTSSGKGWRSKPTTSETKVISGHEYNTALTWLWSGDRAQLGYTFAGYLPIIVTSTSPDGQRRARWTYTFDLKR